MRQSIAKAVFPTSILVFLASSALMALHREPFYTHYFLFAWWSTIFALDCWLYLKGEGSVILEKPADFFGFLAPFSAFTWFVFEAFNLRLGNWHYTGVP